MNTPPLIEDLRINKTFLLAGQPYLVINIDFRIEHDHYVVTARSTDQILYTMLEFKIQPRSPFETID